MFIRFRTAWLAVAAAIALACVLSISAQTKESSWTVTSITELKGITRVIVTVGDVGSSAGKCTWSVGDLRSAATQPLGSGGIKVVDQNDITADAGAPTLKIDAVVKPITDALCVGYLSVDLSDLSTPVVPSFAQGASTFVSNGRPAGPYALMEGDAPGAPPHPVHVALGDVRLLNKGGLLSAAPEAFSKGAQDQVVRIVTAFVSQIKAANQG